MALMGSVITIAMLIQYVNNELIHVEKCNNNNKHNINNTIWIHYTKWTPFEQN